MVRISDVWDASVDAVRGRLGVVVAIAAFAVFLPIVILAGVRVYSAAHGGASPGAGTSLLRLALNLGILVLVVWGALALVAVTGDSRTTGTEAAKAASARLLPSVGVALAFFLIFIVLQLPLFGVLAASGMNMANMQSGTVPDLSPGGALFVGLYTVILVAFVVWVISRLLPIVPVLLHERLGWRSIGRAFRLSRGLGLKLVGASLLFAIVLLVAFSAAKWIMFIPSRLLLGSERVAIADLLGSVGGAVVATLFIVLAYAFTAQLYARLRGHDRSASSGAGSGAVGPREEAHPVT